MKKQCLVFLSAGLVSASLAFTPTAFAEKANNNDIKENIEVTQQSVTKDELAAIYVLSEVCPPLVKQDDQFKKGYNNLLKDYLPQEKTPDVALKKLVKESSFKGALKQARADAKTAGDKGNLKVCSDVKDYQS